MERIALCGATGNLMTYLTNVLQEPTATAAKDVNIFNGVATLFPLLGAFIADAYFGRFKTILFSSLIYVMVSTALVFSLPVYARLLVTSFQSLAQGIVPQTWEISSKIYN